MTDERQPNNPELLKKLGELHLKLQHYRNFSLENGRWKPEHVLALLEIRKEALALTEQAVREGFNRGTIVESLLADFGIHAEYPTF